MHTKFIAEVSSNHHQDINRCYAFIEKAAELGCDAVKFQLFKIDQLFAPEILTRSEDHRKRKEWELPLGFLPQLKRCCDENNIEFSCTPFYLKAVDELSPYVNFLKVASYELLWDELLIACARSALPVIFSSGMANLSEIDAAVATLKKENANAISLLHCVSAYPTPEKECNLSVLQSFRQRYDIPVGWSDHSVSPAVLQRAVHHWQADIIEFHLDLDAEGEEYAAGHCWLPEEIRPIIEQSRRASIIDGSPHKQLVDSEACDRDWRADPNDGLRPLQHLREGFIA